jgi:hypothetical protein
LISLYSVLALIREGWGLCVVVWRGEEAPAELPRYRHQKLYLITLDGTLRSWELRNTFSDFPSTVQHEDT